MPIQHKRSTTPGAVPSLLDGQLGLNTVDGKLFWKDNAGVVQSLDLKATGGGGGTTHTTRTKFFKSCDCLNPGVNTAEEGFTYTAAGTGAAWTALATGTDNAVGIARLALGTTATGRGSIATTHLGAIRLGTGVAKSVSKTKLLALSTATTTFFARIGFINNVTAESTNGVFFRYSHGLNAGKWQAVCRANGVETVVDTGVVAAINTWLLMEIEVNAAGTSAAFRINDALVATITTNIPNIAGREVGTGVFYLKTLGTAAVNAADVDYTEAELVFTTSR